jgi:hypothetical protein
MPSLTIPEKKYWRKRIARKIDKKIAAIAAQDPGWLERLAEQARQRALHSLGLADIQAELDTIAAQKKEWQRRQRRAYRAMLAVLRRVPLEEVEEIPSRRRQREAGRAIRKRQFLHEEELLAQDERGREILRWLREKDNLLDPVWLATAPSSLQVMWQKVVELLGEDPTPLEKAVQASGSKEAAT